jgi:uncharacterized membrane protein
MTSLVYVRSQHHTAFVPADLAQDQQTIDLLDHNGISKDNFFETIQRCYNLHQPMQEIQANATRAFKLVSIWYLVALIFWIVSIIATAVTVPLAYRWIARPVFYLVFFTIQILLLVSMYAIEWNNQKDKSTIWNRIEQLLRNENARYNHLKLSVVSERHAKYIDVNISSEREKEELQLPLNDAEDFITIDLQEEGDKRGRCNSHYYVGSYSRLDEAS